MKILMKFPVRDRIEKFYDTLSKYDELMSGENEHRYLVSLDEDDKKFNNAEVIGFLEGRKDISYFIGARSNKITAVNRDMNKDIGFGWDIVLLISDDMIPLVNGYDKRISDDMVKYFPDLDGALWYYDGHNKITATQTIMGRKYYERFGYLYHPIYKTLECDREYTIVGQRLEKLKFFEDVIIEHQHIHEVLGERDKLDLENGNIEWCRADARAFKLRESMGFDLS